MWSRQELKGLFFWGKKLFHGNSSFKIVFLSLFVKLYLNHGEKLLCSTLDMGHDRHLSLATWGKQYFCPSLFWTVSVQLVNYSCLVLSGDSGVFRVLMVKFAVCFSGDNTMTPWINQLK